MQLMPIAGGIAGTGAGDAAPIDIALPVKLKFEPATETLCAVQMVPPRRTEVPTRPRHDKEGIATFKIRGTADSATRRKGKLRKIAISIERLQ